MHCQQGYAESHSQKVEAEALISEEQAGFRKNRKTAEEIFNLRILCEKHIEQQKEIHHCFVDFKKVFERVWQTALWKIMEKKNIDKYLEGFEPTISIGGRKLCNLRFADDIDLFTSNRNELQIVANKLNIAASNLGMKISTEKTKTLTTRDRKRNEAFTTDTVSLNAEVLEEVNAFKYLGAEMNNNGRSEKEVRHRIATATSALSKLNRIWRDRNTSLETKMHLLRTIVISTLLYGAETWTLTSAMERNIAAFEMRAYRRLLQISYLDHITNESIRKRKEAIIGKHEYLIDTIRKRTLKWFGHVCKQNDTTAKYILQGKVEGARKQGRPRLNWTSNILDWTGLTLGEQQESRAIGRPGGLWSAIRWCSHDPTRVKERTNELIYRPRKDGHLSWLLACG